MEYRDKVKVALTVVSLTALAVILTSEFRRLRRRWGRKLSKRSRSSCYLHSDQKPQLSFKRVLADNSYSQFKHFKNPISGNSSNAHPYESEINALIENPPPLDIEYDFDDHRGLEMSDSYVWVETESQLNDLALALSKECVFVVDTEQHSLRSFLGFTSLVQISTRNQDYLVDAIALHDSMSVLAPVFANPNICKVFHGADNDVRWLQRDFHVYVVNLFDTAKACELLSKPQKSLAYLLETYCGVATNKLLQREDWRQRPLSAEMLQYARIDVHYLLHIAGFLIAELKQLSSDNSLDNKIHFLIEASRRSNSICLQLYSKELEAPPGESAASSIFSRHLNGQGSLSISCETQDLVRRLCTWRDVMARIHDESLRYVLSDQAIALLAAKAPKTHSELCTAISQADLNGDPINTNASPPSPSPLVCCHLDDLHILIQETSQVESVFQVLIEKCLGPNGGCPLSVYNYALLLHCDLQLTAVTAWKQNGFRNTKRIARKASRELFVQKFSCKAPVYHNCRIFANDGRLLCYCDRRKLEWYLHRDLAKLVDDDPPAIMLLFEPKGRPEDEGNDFYIQSKKNVCVGCGEGSHYLRYRIIPSCYRMHFPEHLKSHRSHDIVLLCVDCHEVAHAAAEKYKKQIAAEFGIPLFVRKVVDSKEQPVVNWLDVPTAQADEFGVSPLQLRTAAMALLRHGQRMPAERQRELTQIIMQYYGGRELTKEDLERALLVGMSPQERRKFEKKRGFSFKHSSGRSLPDKEQTDSMSSEAQSALNFAAKTDLPCEVDDFGRIEPTCIEGNNGDCEHSAAKDVDPKVADHNCLESSSKTASGLQDPGYVGDTAPRDKLKLSLLGHGPHGKQVVNQILEEEGEEGIREFCQRWRKVFVEAIQPRFLPAGWDVMHSGRRDFGDYSVYNPAKKTSAAK